MNILPLLLWVALAIFLLSVFLSWAMRPRKHIQTIDLLKIKPSADGRRYSQYPNGDAPVESELEFLHRMAGGLDECSTILANMTKALDNLDAKLGKPPEGE